MVRQFDGDQDGRLAFKEFLPFVLPLDAPGLRSKVSQREPYKVGPQDLLPRDVEAALASLIRREEEMHLNVEAIKEDLVSRYDFNILEAFKTVDIHHSLFTDFDNLSAYLAKEGAGARYDDVLAFIRRLDKDLDGRVSYTEFMEGMLPAGTRGAKQRPGYTTATQTSLARSETVVRSPERPVPLPTHSATVSGRPRSSMSFTGSAHKGGKASVYTTPSKGYHHHQASKPAQSRAQTSAERRSCADIVPRSKSHEGFYRPRPRVPPQSEKKRPSEASPQHSPNGKLDTPLKSILKKKTNEPPMTSPKKSVHIVDQPPSTGLGRLLKRQAQLEKSIESLRQDLAMRKDVTLASMCAVFRFAGDVSAEEFLGAISRLGIRVTKEEMLRLFNRFDRDSDGRLNYTELCEVFLPVRAEYASVLAHRTGPAEMGKESAELVGRLMREYLDAELEIGNVKREMRGERLGNAFAECDLRGRGFFDVGDVRSRNV